MIATGIVLCVLGIIIANLLGDPRHLRYNRWDYTAGLMILAGMVSGAAGVTIFAWRHLP